MKTRTEARRTAILLAATELFKELGYERASMNELAKRLGGSKATVYGYFPSKEDLFAAVVQAVATGHLEEAVSSLSDDAEVPMDVLLTRFGERMLRVLVNDGDAMAVYRMVIAEAGHSVVGRLFHEAGPSQAISGLASVLDAAMGRGELRQADPYIMALQFTALLKAECELRMYEVAPPPVAQAEVRRMVRRAVDMFLQGAASR